MLVIGLFMCLSSNLIPQRHPNGVQFHSGNILIPLQPIVQSGQTAPAWTIIPKCPTYSIVAAKCYKDIIVREAIFKFYNTNSVHVRILSLYYLFYQTILRSAWKVDESSEIKTQEVKDAWRLWPLVWWQPTWVSAVRLAKPYRTSTLITKLLSRCWWWILSTDSHRQGRIPVWFSITFIMPYNPKKKIKIGLDLG